MPPTTVPPLEPARTEDRVRAEAARRAEAGVAAASAERVQAPTAARTLAAPPASLPAPPPVSPPVQKSAPLASVQTPLARRAEPERILDSPNSISIVTETRFLAGCWRVTEPPALVGTLVTPEARAGRGDSLTIVLPQGEYRVRQLGDTLRGALTATRVPCEPPND